jgi:hypothetical protein
VTPMGAAGAGAPMAMPAVGAPAAAPAAAPMAMPAGSSPPPAALVGMPAAGAGDGPVALLPKASVVTEEGDTDSTIDDTPTTQAPGAT